MKKLIIIIYLLAGTALLFAQTPPNISWAKSFGGGAMDWGYHAEQTSDGGYIEIGRMDRGSLNMDAWLIKTDENGDTLWTKTFGDTYIDEAYCVKQTLDGGYILCGMSTAFGNAGEGWLLKTDANGNLLWNHGFHPDGNSNVDWDYFYDMVELEDGSFIVVGIATYSSSLTHQGWIVKVNSNGNIVWNKNYGGDYWQRLFSIEKTPDGGFIAVGDNQITHGDTTSQDGWLVKFNSAGDTLWTRSYGAYQADVFRSVQQTSDGGYMIVGEREPYWGAGFRGWVVRTDDTGNVLWSNTYVQGGLFSIVKTNDGNFIIAGTTNPAQTLDDVWVIRIKDNGEIIWENTYAVTNNDDIPQSIRQTLDGGYIISGYSNWDGNQGSIMLLKLEADQPAALNSFTESFDGVTAPALPEGWTGHLEVLITNTVAEIKTVEHGLAPSQPNAVFIMNGLDGSNGQPDTTAFVALVSPLVDFGENGATVSFWATGGNPIDVGVMTNPNDASTYTQIEEVPITYDFAEYTVAINGITGTGHIAFKHSNLNSVTVLFVDQVTYEEVTPVELTSFTAEVNKNNEVILGWRTATETNNRGFEVERQAGSRQVATDKWETIGFVRGNGTTTKVNDYSFIDNNVSTGKYTYRFKQIDFDGTYSYSNEVEVSINNPVQYYLSQNYPNPFNPSTRIDFTLPVNSEVTLKVYNTLGQEVKTLIRKEMTMGNHEIEFTANELVSGVYFYSIDAKGSDNMNYHSVKKMMLIR